MITLRSRLSFAFRIKRLCGAALALCTATMSAAQPAKATPAGVPTPVLAPLSGDVIQFLDGSSLHGELRAVDPQRGVRWQHPEAKQLIDFKPTNIESVRFHHSRSVSNNVKSSCKFRFSNGDEFFGSLLSLNEDSLALETWFGKSMKVPRSAMDSIAFVSRNFRVLYEGPNHGEGWNFGKGGPAWQYRDGALVAGGIGTVGRNFKLPGMCVFEFDLSWAGDFNLIVPIYSETIDRFDYSTSSYMFHFSPYSVVMQRVHNEMGVVNLDRAKAIPNPNKKNSYHIEFRASKEDALLALFVDGAMIGKWHDDAGFSAKGSGVVFFCQHEGPMLKISNIKLSEWDGKFEEERPEVSKSKEDVLHLANRDRVVGKLGTLKDGKIQIGTGDSGLEIPLPRVTQIFFGGQKTNSASRDPWEVRALFAGGEKISFKMDQWDEHQVAGMSPSLGKVSFAPKTIRQVQFNLDKTPVEAPTTPQDDWDLSDRTAVGAVSVGDAEDAVMFRNGDLLHGVLQLLDPHTGLRWRRTDVAQPIDFGTDDLAELRFRQETNALSSANCRVVLSNGDQLEGQIISVDPDKIVLETPYAGKLSFNRKRVAMIAPINVTKPPVFEGPSTADGWTMGKVTAIQDAGEWQYKGGAFYASKAASIARDLNLPDVAQIQFDLGWKGTLNMAVALYTSRLQPINLQLKDSEPDFGGFYSLRLYSYGSTLMSVKKDAPIKDLWPQTPVPAFTQTNTARVQILINKPKSLITVIVNGQMIKSITDTDGFAGSGTAMRFVHQGLGSLKLSNLRITEWDGQVEEKPTNSKGERDLTKLRNADKVSGEVEAYRGGKFVVNADGAKLEIPIERVKQIEFAGKKLETSVEEGREVTAYFRGGYAVNFRIERWDEKGLSASSPSFGKAVFNPAAFNRIVFKHPK